MIVIQLTVRLEDTLDKEPVTINVLDMDLAKRLNIVEMVQKMVLRFAIQIKHLNHVLHQEDFQENKPV